MELKRGDRIKRRDKAQVYIVSRVKENKKGKVEVKLATHDKNLMALPSWHSVENLVEEGYRKLAQPANLTRLRKRKRDRLVRLTMANPRRTVKERKEHDD